MYPAWTSAGALNMFSALHSPSARTATGLPRPSLLNDQTAPSAGRASGSNRPSAVRRRTNRALPAASSKENRTSPLLGTGTTE